MQYSEDQAGEAQFPFVNLKGRTMTTSNNTSALRPQAVVTGDIADSGALRGRAGTAEFPIGGPDGRGGTATGANPYDLLSASLAACTAMTIRLHAHRKKYPLSHVEVAVSYHHTADGGRNSFERLIMLEGSLDDEQRSQLMQVADMCPVGKTLGLSADIYTSPESPRPTASNAPANYAQDLEELSIINIDPD
jgi:putative redox protein